MSSARPLACLCLAWSSACTEGPLGSNDDDDPEDPLPLVDCASVPTVLDSPVGGWVEAQPDPNLTGFGELAVLPGGDLIWLFGHERLLRWTPDGDEVWSYDAEPGDVLSQVAVSATGAIVVGGHHEPDPEHATLLLLRLDADGNVSQREVIDVPDSSSEIVSDLEITAAGDAIVAIALLDPDSIERRLARFDRELVEQWNVAGDPFFELAIDADGSIYTAWMELIEGEPLDYLWAATVTARSPDGELAWITDAIEVSSSGLPIPQLAIGDRVYLLAPGYSDSRLFAFDRDGELAWQHDFYADGPQHHVMTIAASPCGGAWLGGRTNLETIDMRASLSSMTADGSLGPIVALTNDLPDDYRFAATTQLAVSPLGDVIATGDLQRLDASPDRVWIKAY